MRSVSKGFFVFAGLLASPVIPKSDIPKPQVVPAPPVHRPAADPRLARLKQFFTLNRCPINHLAADFIEAADRQELDWRLLPSIAVVESGGGRKYRNNNVFGWANGKVKFSSVKDSIHVVAGKLANSRPYRDKDTDGILQLYNPRREYGRRVKAVMNMIGMVNPQPVGALN